MPKCDALRKTSCMSAARSMQASTSGGTRLTEQKALTSMTVILPFRVARR